MPPAMMLPQMMVELAVYGLVAGLCEKYISQKNEMTKLYMSFVTCLPGVILQLIVIPVLVRSLNKNIYKQPEKVLAE